MTRQPPELLKRALLALIGQLGFYGLGGGLVLGLLAIPWAQARYQHGPGPGGLIAGVAALVVAVALLPRSRPNEIHGLRLEQQEQPRLFALLERVSARVGVPLPDEIWLVPEANAFIGRAGRLRRTRRMGLGFGLMQVLDEDELSTVIGHELGHARGGDVALGPWVLGTRNAIQGTLERLDGEGISLHLPFQWYGRWFMRATLAVSRAQELAADGVAASVAGPAVAGSALQRVHAHGPLWDAYWRSEVVPLLLRGHLPPLAEGFRLFLGTPKMAALAAELSTREHQARTEAGDSHPALPERLAALRAAGDPPVVREGSASDLLDGDLERPLVLSVLVGPGGTSPKVAPLRWEDAGEDVYLAALRADLAPFDATLGKIGAPMMAEILRQPARWLAALRPPGPNMLSEEAQRRRLISMLSGRLTLLLKGAGWRASALPGEAIRMHRADEQVEPQAEVLALAAGEVSEAGWRARVMGWGLG